MSEINFMGSYSGIDGTMIANLMKVEKMPLVQYANQKTNITETQNAWKDINTRLNSLFDKIKNLGSTDSFQSKASISTNEDYVTITPSKNSLVGRYNINIQQLASNTSIIGSQRVTEKFTQDGSFTIKNADDNSSPITIDVKAGESLRDIANKINETTRDKSIEYKLGDKTLYGSGISATIIDNKIILTDENTGDRKISLDNVTEGQGDFDPDILGKLGLESSVSGDQGNQGKKALFTINGISVERDTNSIDDLIENATINLKKAHDNASATEVVSVTMDSEKTAKAVQDFVDQYNSTIRFIEDKMAAGDPEIPGSKGALSGDSSLMRLHSSLRQMVTSSIGGNPNSNIKDISQLGVTTIDKFGQLQFDSSKLQDALKEDPESVINFFKTKTDDGKEFGFINRINTQIDGFISKSNGIIKSKNESYDKTLKALAKRIEDFEARMERKEKYYVKMFSALDVAMMQAESQMSWLQGQVDAMNMSGTKR